MRDRFIKLYGILLFGGGAYYTFLLVLQFSAIYDSWKSWAHPTYDSSTYSMLFLFYLLAIGTPLIMFVSGLKVYKTNSLKLNLAIPLVVFLVLSSLVGKLILASGAGIYVCSKWCYARK
jgi:hypothetical protein